MPQFRRSIANLTKNGPVLELRIEPVLAVQEMEILRANGQEVPSVSLRGLIDTGASSSLLESTVFDTLGIEPYAFVDLYTASTTAPLRRGKYRVRVVLTETIAFEVDAVSGTLTGQNIQCLIGRDVLEELVFTYNSPKNNFTVTYRE